MAMYHFRIKSDKKPNGTKVSAVKHVEYINREGTFAHDEHWKETNKFVNNFITTAQSSTTLSPLLSRKMCLTDLIPSYTRPMILALSKILNVEAKSPKMRL